MSAKNEKRKRKTPVTRVPPVRSIDDLIALGRLYESPTFCPDSYTVNVKGIHDTIPALADLRDMVGLESVKRDIVDFVLFHSQDLHVPAKPPPAAAPGVSPPLPNASPPPQFVFRVFPVPQTPPPSSPAPDTFDAVDDDAVADAKHMVIVGPPGTGKTAIARIIGRICLALGICSRNVFKSVRRSDLVGEFLGHTAIKTQRAIDDAAGGVLFIDEAYSLGSVGERDAFSKECLDTLNYNLTALKGQLVCIIAGYEEELERLFFSANPGLRRRFAFRFRVGAYSWTDLTDIFLLKVRKIGWAASEELVRVLREERFFQSRTDDMPNFGGDVETLLFHVKIEHGKRVFGLPTSSHKLLLPKDLTLGWERYVRHRNSVPDKVDAAFRMMFL